jgi:hypothetical protein
MRFYRVVFLVLLIFWVFFSYMPCSVHAASPVGFLDRADFGKIFGWAKDADYSGSIYVHIYVDGQFVKQLTANDYRSDLGGNYGFSWSNLPAFGPGDHIVHVYALGVNSAGQLDGVNPELSNSPKNLLQTIEFSLNSSSGNVQVVVDSR